MTPYRVEAQVRLDDSMVAVDRGEYARLLRAAEVLRILEESSEYICCHGTRRYPWEITLYDGYDLADGRGASLQESVEDAACLPPVERWTPPAEPRRTPWGWLFLGALAVDAALRWFVF